MVRAVVIRLRMALNEKLCISPEFWRRIYKKDGLALFG
jgi:hypothetical protein